MRSLVRTSAFARGEIVSTLRQPRLLLMLVLGPFLVLFVFGLGYEHDLPELTTVVVGTEGELTDEVDSYIRQEEPAGIAYEGTSDDEDAAMQALRDGELDLVVVLPDDPLDQLGQDERATIEVHQRSLDPVTFSQISVAADIAVAQINDHVITQVIATTQQQTQDVDDQVAEARSALDTVRSAVDERDVAAVQRTARQLAPQLDELAELLESGTGVAGFLGFGDDLDDTVGSLRSASEQLGQLAELDAVGQLDDAATTLDEVDDAIQTLQSYQPEVAARPFASEVVSQTPVAVTLDRFYAPGLVALMLQHLGVTFAALTIVRERQQGTIDMLRVSPASTGERLAGKTLAFVVLGIVVAAALTALAMLAFDVPAPADWLAFVALLALTLIASIGLGFLAAALSSTDGQAVQISMLLLLAAIFFSGLFMPLDRIQMPVAAVSWLLPATYAFTGMQDLMLLAAPASPWLFVGLAAIAAAAFAAARLLIPRRARGA